MDRILKILKKENGPRASSAPALELNTIIFKHVYWCMQQISGERLQDHWSSGFTFSGLNYLNGLKSKSNELQLTFRHGMTSFSMRRQMKMTSLELTSQFYNFAR